MERVISKEKRTALKIFREISDALYYYEDKTDDINRTLSLYENCDDYPNNGCFKLLDKYEKDNTLEKKMRELVRLHNEFEKAFDAYANYVDEVF